MRNEYQRAIAALSDAISNRFEYLPTWCLVTNIHYYQDFLRCSPRCSNVFHIIELLLITPYSNTKLEKMFSVMAPVKTDLQNWMRRDRLEASFRISEEEVPITKYCLNAAINLGFDIKVRQLNCSGHSYLKQWKVTAASSKDVIGITELTMSILEAEKEESNNSIPYKHEW